MSVALAFTQQQSLFNCSGCGIAYSVPASFEAKRREDGKTFYCPNGHTQVFVESEVQRLEKRLSQAQREAEYAKQDAAAQRRRAEAEERRTTTYKGLATKERNKRVRLETRAANGVCPCCNRSFVQLARHMRSQHPDFVHQEHE
jgi:hypothetical protein